MSIFFDEDKALTPASNESWSKGARTDISENFDAVWTAFGKSEMSTSEHNNISEEYGNVVQLLHENGNTNFVNPIDEFLTLKPLGSGASSIFGVHSFDFSKRKSKEQLEEEFWLKVEDAKKNNEELNFKLTEAGLDNKDNFQKTISKKALDAWKEYSAISERATTSGKIVGGFGGMAARAFTDPIMAAAVVASFGYSVPATFSAAALRVAYMEAIIGGVAETMIQLKAQPYREELGFEDAGWETGLRNVFMVAGASAVLSPALLGVFKAFGKGIDIGKKHLLKMPAEDLQKINKEMGDLNPKYKNTDLDNIEIPKKDNPFPDNAAGRTEHRERLDLAVKSVNESTPLDLPPPRNPIIVDKKNPFLYDFEPSTLKKTEFENKNIKNYKGDKSETIVTTIMDGKHLILDGHHRVKLAEKDKKLIRGILIPEKAYKEMKAKGIHHAKMYDEFVATYDLKEFGYSASKINSPNINKAGFNKNETKLAEDIEGVKDFDVPTEATYRNQALNSERSVFDVSTSNPIKSEAGTGAAAKTSPTELSDKFQVLSAGSQKTDATPVSVLAKANTEPPLLRGSDTNRVGDISDISKDFIYHKSQDFNEIYKTLSKKMKDVTKDLNPITTKYNGELKARIKDINELNKKLNHKIKPKKAEHISDYLGTRISTDTIMQAKMVLSDLNKVVKFIHIDDFLSDGGRAASAYRAIHAQVLTKDGFSFELQIRLKDLDPLTEQSHAIYKKKKFPEKEYTDAEYSKIVKEEAAINKKLENKYFEIKDKEFSRLNSKNEVDVPIIIGTRLDENGDKVPLTKTARELFEEEAKDVNAMKVLEQCMGW